MKVELDLHYDEVVSLSQMFVGAVVSYQQMGNGTQNDMIDLCENVISQLLPYLDQSDAEFLDEVSARLVDALSGTEKNLIMMGYDSLIEKIKNKKR